ncbi:MAG: Fic family protein [Eubacteriales bacterium]
MRTFDYDSFETAPIPGEVRLYLALIKEYKGKLQDLYLRKPDTLNKMIHFARQRGAGSSNRLEGIATSDKRLAALLDGEVKPVNRAEKEILGYKYCLDLIRKNHVTATITPGYIMMLHESLYRYCPSPESGRFITPESLVKADGEEAWNPECSESAVHEDEVIRQEDLPDAEMMNSDQADPHYGNPDRVRTVHFVPVTARDKEQAMRDLCNAYNRAMAKNNVSSLILGMQFVLDFLCISPFKEGNGRMSRLLMLLILYQNDYKAGKCISLETMIEKTRKGYCESLHSSTQNWQEGTNNPWPFISYMLGIILAAYRELENRFV